MSFKGRMEVIAGILAFFAGAGCEINHCETGANCEDEDKRGVGDERSQCVAYCGRISVCGGPRADNLEGCIDACEQRFRALPEETAALCACAPRSACSDVNEGRCSEGSPGSGAGAGGSGVASGAGGTASGAGGGYSAGGNSSTGGASAGTGSSGGASVDAGHGSGTPCVRDCDCPANETCIAGFCGS
jgi:hypothetical protein